jgi:hypothetical protein
MVRMTKSAQGGAIISEERAMIASISSSPKSKLMNSRNELISDAMQSRSPS